jgi:hypothetical protein
MRFLGGITKVYNVYFLHQRNDEVEYETIEANSEKEAIKLATAKHRKTYPRVRFELLKVK